MKPSIVWFRQDLRCSDQPALNAAIAKGGPVIPLFIWAPEEEGEWAPGAASRWWLNGSLTSLQEELKGLGLTLIIRKGSSQEALLNVIKQTGADTVYWNRRYEPHAVKRDATIKKSLHQHAIASHLSNDSLLYDPTVILTKQKKPYQVFTPFSKACAAYGEPDCPLDKPTKALPYLGKLPTDSVSSLGLLPKVRWDTGLKREWEPGAQGALHHLEYTAKNVIGAYSHQRDLPAVEGTSRLSPYLHFGEISARMIWHRLKSAPESDAFLRQLIWREFAYHLLVHFPQTPHEGLRSKFHTFPWKDDLIGLHAWQKGLTGYPIVDAGMRQLWETGWMHNRVRMIVGSFLVKDLLIDWREGARWFWDTLVDADLANNTLGWQWVGGCGADAAPYFRIFNPILQGEKFDSDGAYVRHWIPEIASLPNKWIHQPWKAPKEILETANIILGKTYPFPIVDHNEARKRALDAYEVI